MAQVYDVGLLAPAWLGVLQASGTDAKELPLYRTVEVEFHATGLRLTSTDRFMLLSAWVPARLEEDDPNSEPDRDEAPKGVAVAMDTSHRARGLLDYAWSLYDDERDDPLEVQVGLEDVAQEVPEGTLFPEPAEGEMLVFDLPGHERVRLRLYEGRYPEWRRMDERFAPKRTTQVALATDVLKRLAAAGKFYPGQHLVWHWGGADRVARVELGHLRGLVMPERWEPAIKAERDVEEVAEAAQRVVDSGMRLVPPPDDDAD